MPTGCYVRTEKMGNWKLNKGKFGKFHPKYCKYRSNNIPKYDIYISRLEPYEECRRNQEDYNILEIKCTYCGKWFIPTIIQANNRIIFLDKDCARFYCSNECKQECPIYHRRNNYKGENGFGSREVQPELRQLVFARDKYTCQKCSQYGGKLECHHIDPVVNNPIESADIDNCITLCRDCHKWIHMNIDKCGYGYLRDCV